MPAVAPRRCKRMSQLFNLRGRPTWLSARLLAANATEPQRVLKAHDHFAQGWDHSRRKVLAYQFNSLAGPYRHSADFLKCSERQSSSLTRFDVNVIKYLKRFG
jgi:hypothetical protein